MTNPISDDARRLLGSWTLVSWTRLAADGSVRHPHTERGTGRLIYAPQGRMCGFLMSPRHLEGVVSDPPQFVAYSGRYEIVDGIAQHHVDFANDLRMMAKVLRRSIHWLPSGDLRLLTLPAEGAAERESSHELVWRRDP